MGSSPSSIFKPVVNTVEGSLGLNGWKGLRDSAETLGSLAGNYLLPGSSLVTDNLVSKGSQNNLSSPIGQLAQIGTGLTGSGAGQSTTGIPSASDVGAGWGNAANAAGLTGEGSLLGTTAGTPVEGGVGPTQGSGVLGSVTRSAPSLSSMLSGGSGTSSGGGASSFLPLGTALAGGATSLYENDQAQKNLVDAENKALGQLSPYTATGAAANSRLSDLLGNSGNTGASGYGSLTAPFTAASLQSDPGYQFELGQLNNALDRKAAASGNYFSGNALKEAQQFGQGLADTTLNQAFNRDLATKNQIYSDLAGQAGSGLSAANAAGNAFTGIGNAQAGSNIATGNTINNTLSSLLSGSGAKRPYNINGQVYYF